MKLSEFRKEMIEDIDKFSEHWLDKNVSNARDWPLEMEPGDWYDQFLIFEANKDE
jgi:hypothetical protein